LDASGDPSSFSGRVVLGAGTVGDLNNPEMRIGIDHATAQVRWQAGMRGLNVERVQIVAGQNSGELNGTVLAPAHPG
ncbi:hypothetical protein ABTF39_21465, partial [Acinetobacter baumannii]